MALTSSLVAYPAGTDAYDPATDMSAEAASLNGRVVMVCTASTRPGSPSSGMPIFETDTKRFGWWNGAAWAYTTDVAHARFVATATGAIGTAWSTVAINSTIDSSASPPYSLAAGVVTISQPGVYLLSATVSASVSTFALRIAMGAAIVAQTAVASGASLTQSLDRCIRVTAGSAVKVEIYATVASTHAADSLTLPVSLTITQIGL